VKLPRIFRRHRKIVLRPELLLACIDYDAATGRMGWKAAPSVEWFHADGTSAEQKQKSFVTRHVGKAAFDTKCVNGYLKGGFLGREYLAHRVVWAIHHGAWPEGEIDHINGDRSDNRIENLRCVDHATNCRNTRRLDSNTSGCVGVSWARREERWEAYIKFNRHRYSLGYHRNLDDAIAARKAAERRFGFHENHGRTA
jgi:hypothetical protein